MRDRAVIKALLLAILLTATINLSWQIYTENRHAAERQRISDETGGAIIICKLGLAEDEAARFKIEIALIVAFIGSCLKRSKGKIISTAGLLFATIVYVSWWRYLSYIIEASGTTQELPNIAYLYNANYYDVCIAFSVSVLLAWQLSRLVVSLFFVFRPATSRSVS